MNSEGRLLVPPVFRWIYPVSVGGKFLVYSGNEFGFVDATGRYERNEALTALRDSGFIPSGMILADQNLIFVRPKTATPELVSWKASSEAGVATLEGKWVLPPNKYSVIYLRPDTAGIVGCMPTGECEFLPEGDRIARGRTGHWHPVSSMLGVENDDCDRRRCVSLQRTDRTPALAERFAELEYGGPGYVYFKRLDFNNPVTREGEGFLRVEGSSVAKTFVTVIPPHTYPSHLAPKFSEGRVFSCRRTTEDEWKARPGIVHWCNYFNEDGHPLTNESLIYGTPFSNGWAVGCVELERNHPLGKADCFWLDKAGTKGARTEWPEVRGQILASQTFAVLPIVGGVRLFRRDGTVNDVVR
jgi:hypothetical protein